MEAEVVKGRPTAPPLGCRRRRFAASPCPRHRYYSPTYRRLESWWECPKPECVSHH
jgi:hypothetical protein